MSKACILPLTSHNSARCLEGQRRHTKCAGQSSTQEPVHPSPDPRRRLPSILVRLASHVLEGPTQSFKCSKRGCRGSAAYFPLSSFRKLWAFMTCKKGGAEPELLVGGFPHPDSRKRVTATHRRILIPQATSGCEVPFSLVPMQALQYWSLVSYQECSGHSFPIPCWMPSADGGHQL